MFDLQLKKEISQIRQHLKDSSRSATSSNTNHYKLLAMEVEAERRKNDRAEQEIKNMMQIKQLLV